MLIYNGTKKKFCDDVTKNNIASIIKQKLYEHHIVDENIAEFRAWENSLHQMKIVLDTSLFSDDIQIAVEYQIPQTSKRVDFIIAGCDEQNQDHVVVIELKQWEEAGRTRRNGVVTAFTGGRIQAVAHPSYQAYSYAKTIENFNASVQDEAISLHPCAYLHNYRKSKLEELTAPLYQEIIELSPLFIKEEENKLRKFIQKYVAHPSSKNLMYEIDNGKIRPSKALQDALVSMLKGNPEFVMIDEQKVVYETVLELVNHAEESDEKYTVIVKGGPGTGKSVVAVNLLSAITNSSTKDNHGCLACYVTKNAAPRNVYFEKLKQGKVKYGYVKNLFKGSGNFVDAERNQFTCLIVDEAHRLNEKSGMYQNLGENQIKEIINAAKVSVFFIDEEQIVTSKDIGSVAEIEKWARECGSTLYRTENGEHLELTSQFRCNGSDGYLAFIDDVLEIRHTANADGFDMDYDIQFFDDPKEMRSKLRILNEIPCSGHLPNKARMLAGYCYEWKTKKNATADVYDIELENGFKARWNFSTTNTWAIDDDSFDQVGCIHTSQGLEFDYVGVIIGKDLRYENGHVITDITKRAGSDQSVKGLRSHQNDELADKIIRNTYRTLLTRGQKGCYIYCENRPLMEYLKSRVEGCIKPAEETFSHIETTASQFAFADKKGEYQK